MNGDFELQLRGGRLTTAEVIYHMPDHPGLLQEFLWQTIDIAPDFPRIRRFLDFWRAEIDAVIHTVNLTCVGLVAPPKVRLVEHHWTIN